VLLQLLCCCVVDAVVVKFIVVTFVFIDTFITFVIRCLLVTRY
jgi:hypothetical protein